MQPILSIPVFLLLVACNVPEKTDPPEKTVDFSTNHLHANDTAKPDEVGYFDSLRMAVVDTTDGKGKREWIRNQFIVEFYEPSPVDDTLFDLTFDGVADYVIRYYGRSGTGIKNGVEVYLFNRKCLCYIRNEQLSDLRNPTFYLDQKKITGFYLGNGGGGGARLEWINNEWTVTKEFDVDGKGDSTEWVITYPLKKKKEIKVQPYQMIPPGNILETNINW